MDEQHRYQGEEVSEILDLAIRAEARRPLGAGGSGITLREIQDAAIEAGIDPQRVADAAFVLASRQQVIPAQRVLGLPVSVTRVVELPRPLSSGEWEILVSELRDTFAAPGQVGSQGEAREWRNGRLRVLLEPAASGQRLRMTTLNRRLRTALGVGAAELIAGLSFLGSLVPTASAGGFTLQELMGLVPSVVVTATGLGILGWARSALPRWAAERSSQMDEVAMRVRALLEESPTDSAVNRNGAQPLESTTRVGS